MLTKEELNLILAVQKTARTRLKELHGLWTDLVAEKPTREEVVEDLIAQREDELGRVLTIFTECQDLIDEDIRQREERS